MEFEYFNKRSKRLFDIYINKNGNFKRYFDELDGREYFYNTNKIPDNNYFNLSAFQAIEIYNKYNKKEIKKNFYKFSKLSSKNNKQKYKKLISQVDKIIDEMASNKYVRSSNTMLDFEFEINEKIIRRIKIFLEVVGSGLYRIGYNIYLQDEYYYKFWLLMVNNYPNTLQITNIPILNHGKILVRNGDDLKVAEIIKFQKIIKSEIYKFIRKIAPGIFIKLYRIVPVIMVMDLTEIKYLNKIHGHLFEIKNTYKNTKSSFYVILRNDSLNDFNDFYYNRDCCDTYIPSKINNYLKPDIFSKHLRNPDLFTPTNLLFWLEIVVQLYKIQVNQIDIIQNKYIYNTIQNNSFGLSNARKKLYQTEALLRLLGDSYEIEKREFEKPYNNKLKYLLNNSDELDIEYFENNVKVIEYSKAKALNLFPNLKEIYDKKKDEQNNGSNIFFQIIAIILTIFTIMQTVYQCNTNSRDETDNHNKKIIKNIIVNKANE
jgi:hypothetical protein